MKSLVLLSITVTVTAKVDVVVSICTSSVDFVHY